ncbi:MULTISPECIES: polyprenyl synthetase family protein [unclassified Pseudonocardia]|jgi:geranylgeranyl diphosphate synthase type I|uniref:polyprenyl synthetase family protein n=1 Tax=unclassified Pseudonocardia TaxID=2619320 RepID=UPI000961A069|nr:MULTISPECIES: polyprenyl synthetase family protein [unclassified Pseudonocardia]MBN9098548.1 polyprenyl synthetase family protein [Pseudonocardia sp.]OJY40552.1 MAG: dimethylallyltranstransferase [Pseudonocardia sp. 73-21]
MSAPATLARCRDLVTPALQAAVDRLDRASREQSRYHLGWTGLDGSPGPGAGKAVRPALALLSAEAAGADAAAGLPGAVAVELVHNFSLLHDDLMDGDTERRHRPTVWARWGAPSAILAGDGMLAVAVEVLLEADSPHAASAAHLLSATVRELVRGQVEDVAFEGRTDVGVQECLDMAAGKTGSLLATSASIGAVLAGAPALVTTALHTFGGELGAAFQLVDDLLGIWGDPAVTGKPVLSDLRSRKKSLPVTYAVNHGGADGRELAAWLAGTTEPTDAELLRAAALVEAGGGREWAAAEARRRLALAEKALAGADLPDRPRAELVALGRYLAIREF